MSPGLCLDAGALIALERGDQSVRTLLFEASAASRQISIVAPVLAQVWREGWRQARLARLLRDRAVTVHPLDTGTAKAVGRLCGHSGHADVVDVHVALHARLHHQVIVTADPDDIRAVDPGARMVAI